MKFHIKGEVKSVKGLHDQIKAELSKGLGWRKLMMSSSILQEGDSSVIEINSRPAFLLRRNETARIQLETLMNVLLIEGAKGSMLEKTEI